MNRLVYTGRIVICMALMAISVTAVLIARKWPFQTALFPVVIGLVIFVLSIPTLILLLMGKGEDEEKQAAVDSQLSTDDDEADGLRKTVIAFGWVFGFFLLILCLGFPAAIIIFILSYARFQGGESWGLSLGLALISWLFVWGLFIRLLHIPFQDGLVQLWLGALGVW